MKLPDKNDQKQIAKACKKFWKKYGLTNGDWKYEKLKRKRTVSN